MRISDIYLWRTRSLAIICLAVVSVTAKADDFVSRAVGRVVHGQPVVVDFGPQGEGGYPAVEIAGMSRPDVRLRLSYATHPDGLGEKGDFWHETRATYLGADVLLPIPPASTDRFDVFGLTEVGVAKAGKAQGLVRYVRVAVDTPGATVDVVRVSLENRGVHSTEPAVGSFACSDEALTRLWQASVRTCQLAAIPARGNDTLPYLSDGAKRDRLVWSGDLWWAQRNMYAAFAPTSPYMPGSLDALAENQTPAGYINACPYPESRGPITSEVYGPFGSDEFAAWYVPVLADHYLYTGDQTLLKRRYPNVVRLMDYLSAHQGPDGLFEQRAETAKHSEGLAVGGTSLHHRCYMHLLLWRAYEDAARLAGWMGIEADRARFRAGADRLARLLRERFYDAKTGLFVLSLEQPERPAFVANAAAVAFGFATGEEAVRILGQLKFNDHGKFQLLAVRGAFAAGDGRKAGELIDAHRWRQVVEDSWQGVRLTSECMRLRRKGWGDEAHPDTALAGELTDYVLGVRPLEPGHRSFVVDPVVLPGVTWAKGRVPTSAGFIEVEWTLVDGRPDVKVKAPPSLKRVLLQHVSPIRRVGVVNWDCSVPSTTFFGHYQTRSLGPAKFRDRTPYYAQVTGTDAIEYPVRDLSAYEKELQYAIDAGVDYFAYCWYDCTPEEGRHLVKSALSTADGHTRELTRARRLHLQSALRDRLGLCAILVCCQPYSDTELCALAQAMKEPCYEKVGERPLLYVFEKPWRETLDRLFGFCRAAGVTSPYVVLMVNGDIPKGNYDGIDAFGAYTTAAQGPTFDDLFRRGQVLNEARAKHGKPTVPMFGLGWDPSPRIERPVPWCRYAKGTFHPPATEGELLTAARAFRGWAEANRAAFPAGHVLSFAWNEFEEGGWVCPTWTKDGPDTSRVKTFRKIVETFKSE